MKPFRMAFIFVTFFLLFSICAYLIPRDWGVYVDPPNSERQLKFIISGEMRVWAALSDGFVISLAAAIVCSIFLALRRFFRSQRGGIGGRI